jgi:hypothetical protein
VALDISSTPREGEECLVAHCDCVLNAGGGKKGWDNARMMMTKTMMTNSGVGAACGRAYSSMGGTSAAACRHCWGGVRRLFLNCARAAFFEKIWMSISRKIFFFETSKKLSFRFRLVQNC